MSLTFIDTNKISRVKLSGSGELAEILNDKLCGAKNVVGSLRWLNSSEKLDVRSDKNTHQLVYLMQGEAIVTLESKDYNVRKGAGVYVGPSETVTIKHAGKDPLKLFHLVVPHLQS
jgi:mannose-6-phosphate isomerase-like protein (cupin superfamily)